MLEWMQDSDAKLLTGQMNWLEMRKKSKQTRFLSPQAEILFSAGA